MSLVAGSHTLITWHGTNPASESLTRCQAEARIKCEGCARKDIWETCAKIKNVRIRRSAVATANS